LTVGLPNFRIWDQEDCAGIRNDSLLRVHGEGLSVSKDSGNEFSALEFVVRNVRFGIKVSV
jgi:hypothetical protein